MLDKFVIFQQDPKIACKICPSSLSVVYVGKKEVVGRTAEREETCRAKVVVVVSEER